MLVQEICTQIIGDTKTKSGCSAPYSPHEVMRSYVLIIISVFVIFIAKNIIFSTR